MPPVGLRQIHWTSLSLTCRACAVGLAVASLLLTSNLAETRAKAEESTSQGEDLFATQVSAILTAKCAKCHGGDSTQGEFDLMTAEGLLIGGASGPAVVPGKASESRLLRLVRHEEDPHMPHEADKLTDEEIAHLAAWIDAGAAYDKPLAKTVRLADNPRPITQDERDFWSYRPLAVGAPPTVATSGWCQTAIDQFIVHRLEAQGLAPNAQAARETLIRRASFDLTGLPPSLEEIDLFLSDAAPDAFDRLVDRLLASPHYGERWGRHWLDLARFAESHGYEQDYDRPTAYHFRDFVIQALNQDMPFDRFVRLQLAGDELEPDNPLALMATGYLAAGTHATQITANQVEKERYDELDDMLATVGTSMLGLTIGCARCHDHKYDPIPQHDYYRMLSTFTTTVRSEVDVDMQPEQTRLAMAKFDARHAPLLAALAAFETEQLPSRVAAWLSTNPPPPTVDWLVVTAEKLESDGGATFTRQDDGSYVAGGNNPDTTNYTFSAVSGVSRITALKIEALSDPSLPKNGPGRADNGNFALSNVQFRVSPPDQDAFTPVTLARPSATFEQEGFPVSAAVDADGNSSWSIEPEFGKDHAATFEVDPPVEVPPGAKLSLVMSFGVNFRQGIGRLRVSVSEQSPAPPKDGPAAPQELVVAARAALAKPAESRTAEDQSALSAWYKRSDSDWQALQRAVDEHARQAPRPTLAKMLISTEGLPAVRLHTQGADFFEETFFLRRGDLRQKEGAAAPGFLQVLLRSAEPLDRWQAKPPAGWRTSYRRVGLANWITDVDGGAGHLLARVIVNRLWQHHFGRGLVNTPSDFGAQGEAPSHPDLLDYLAGELIRQGWRLKPIHRLMMTSAVYRQTADYQAAAGNADPDNKLYWRKSPLRLEAEPIRDSMLAVSGLLERTMFGPGSLDEGHRRRSIYFTTKRSQLVPLMMLFDAPDSLQGLGRRTPTIVAPQALALLNNPHVRQYARSFAQRLLADCGGGGDLGSVGPMVQRGYRVALGRSATPDELSTGIQFVQTQAESYKAAGRPDPMTLSVRDFCQALYSLNEFIYVE